MVSVLVDPTFANSLWCKNLLAGLTDGLRQKRIPFCEIFDDCPVGSDAVFIVAADYEWIKSAIRQLNSAGICPILMCNLLEHIPGCIYSCVCSDINGSMKDLLERLKSKGKSRVALYGVNPNSIADISRVDGLYMWRDDTFDPMRVFVNSGSLKNCFDSFVPDAGQFDAVVCLNDLAAVSLVRNLRSCSPEALDRLEIISCAKSELSEYYRDRITSLDMNFEQYGKAAVYIYECMQKNPYISDMTVSVKWTLGDRRASSEKGSLSLSFDKRTDDFYSDGELEDMLIADKFLSTSDKTDRRIIEMMVSGSSYEKVAEKCFLTENGVKYRMKRMQQRCGAKDRVQLLRILKEYIF